MLTKVQSTFVATLMFCLNFMIYIGLIIFWVQHVIKRILPTKTRGYIIASSFFMILYILQRVVRYRLLINSVIAYRYLGYFYFIPLIMMPSLLLVTAIHLKYGDNKISNNIEKVVIILAVAVSLIALTNDLHRLVYVPKVDEHFIGCLAIIPLQLLGYYLSVSKGLDVDKPRNLAKSVTVE